MSRSQEISGLTAVGAAVVGAAVAALIIPALADAQTLGDPRLIVEIYVDGLQQPTAFTFIGEDKLLLIEKGSGRVRMVRGGRVRRTVLDLNVNAVSERGGLAIEADPAFAENGIVYVYYSAANSQGGPWTANVLASYRLKNNKLRKRDVLLTFSQDSSQANGPNHDGGVIRIGPDAKLYLLVGDLNRGGFGDPRIEQNTADSNGSSSRVGGIARINTDGSIPADNPFADHPVEAVRKWLVYGFRNGFGMDFDPRTGALWFTENGPNVYDEINRAGPVGPATDLVGMNSGWLKIMGPDSRDARYGRNGNRAFNKKDLTELPASVYRDPAFSWLDPIGVTALVFLDSDVLPSNLRDQMVVGDTNTGDIFLFRLKKKAAKRNRLILGGSVKDKVADTVSERNRNRWGEGFGIVTDMRIGPDGLLYISDLVSGRILRVRPK